MLCVRSPPSRVPPIPSAPPSVTHSSTHAIPIQIANSQTIRNAVVCVKTRLLCHLDPMLPRRGAVSQLPPPWLGARPARQSRGAAQPYATLECQGAPGSVLLRSASNLGRLQGGDSRCGAARPADTGRRELRQRLGGGAAASWCVAVPRSESGTTGSSHREPLVMQESTWYCCNETRCTKRCRQRQGSI
mgnify:CR=1 FL=1